MRRLNWDRSYGSIHPWIGRAAFVQDEVLYDSKGYAVDDGPPPIDDPQPLADSAASPKEAVSVSGEQDQSSGVVIFPRPLMEWQTMKFFKLRGALLRERKFLVPNQVAALAYLDKNDLILKGF